MKSMCIDFSNKAAKALCQCHKCHAACTMLMKLNHNACKHTVLLYMKSITIKTACHSSRKTIWLVTREKQERKRNERNNEVIESIERHALRQSHILHRESVAMQFAVHGLRIYIYMRCVSSIHIHMITPVSNRESVAKIFVRRLGTEVNVTLRVAEAFFIRQ